MARDTDADWQRIATDQPFFGVLANQQYFMQNLTSETKDEFYESGIAEVDSAARTFAALNGGDFAPATALDFGCGVGRLTFAMTRYAKSVVGVDIAQGMLDVARREAVERGIGGIELQRELPDLPVDWVNSLIVMQHIPPERGHGIFQRLTELVRPGGFLCVHVTFFRDSRHTAEVLRDLADYRYDGREVELLTTQAPELGVMSMYDYDLNRIMRSLFVGGFESVLAEHTDHGGCHGALLYGVKRQ